MSEKLKIVYRPLQELSPYAHNARTHSTEQVAQLVESIKQFGWTNPVLIDEKGEIIAGHGRVMAAEMLKMDSVPVIVLSGLTDEQKKAYRLADNRLPMNAGWDEDLLRMELSDLINADFDVSLTGFIPTEIDELLTDVLPGKSFYSVMYAPSCVKISLMGASHKRIHHQVTWNNAAVKILHEKYRKKTPCISMGVTNDSVFESRVSGSVPDDCTTNR
ncbi:ParB/Srx family N-terminal domain-containing protein [Escherichia coli]|uniref:ParB/Srx family N-terminal domain-containing protein n=1 Tax=Escherichia coli TaxID=562 RepID=UPI00237BEC99|nr:ParB/Srx family N-terminal domain-containing protein [Escherichia coli]